MPPTEREMIEQFIRERGVTRCPAAIVADCSAVLSLEDRAAHQRHALALDMAEQHQQRGIVQSRKVGSARGGQSRWRTAKAK